MWKRRRIGGGGGERDPILQRRNVHVEKSGPSRHLTVTASPVSEMFEVASLLF